jgi:hypothetical protein
MRNGISHQRGNRTIVETLRYQFISANFDDEVGVGASDFGAIDFAYKWLPQLTINESFQQVPGGVASL